MQTSVDLLIQQYGINNISISNINSIPFFDWCIKESVRMYSHLMGIR